MPSLRREVRLSTIGLLGLSLLLGCSDGPKLPDRSPVSGVVTLNGEPAPFVYVQFIPLDDKTGRSASGQADADGKYVLSTYKTNDGAIPGEYKVVVNRPPGEDQALKDLKKGENSGPKDAGGGKIPEKYSDPKKTELTATVEPSKNDIPLNLD